MEIAEWLNNVAKWWKNFKLLEILRDVVFGKQPQSGLVENFYGGLFLFRFYIFDKIKFFRGTLTSCFFQKLAEIFNFEKKN